MLIDLFLIVSSSYCIYKAVDRLKISDGIISILKSRKSSCNDEYILQVGYQGKVIKNPITVNMKKIPHVLCCGTSGSGKSCCVESFIRSHKNVVLLNVFDEDFRTVKGRRINGNANMLKFLENLVAYPYKREIPLYVVIDEVLILCADKKINKAILDLLAIGRHYGIFVIAVSQRGEKSELSYKNLFNCRICFRQVEESSYRAILGFSPDDKQLNPREFYIYGEEICKGRSYDL